MHSPAAECYVQQKGLIVRQQGLLDLSSIVPETQGYDDKRWLVRKSKQHDGAHVIWH